MKMNVPFYFAYSKMKSIYIFFVLFLSLHDSRNIYLQSSEVNLIIKGPGTQNILYEWFYLDPSEIIVNGESRPLCKKSCEFYNDLNNVTIKFDEEIKTFENMFNGSANIIEIDLSKLDTSTVESMESMFSHCVNLEKINFGNINTKNVVIIFILHKFNIN